MKKVNQKQLMVILLTHIISGMLYAQVSTPNGTSVEFQSYSAGNIVLFENQAAK